MKFYRKYVIALICILFFYAFSTDSFLSKLKSLSYLLRLVDNYYVEEVDLNQIIDGAMHGLLEELDPHSQYIPAKDFDVATSATPEQIRKIFKASRIIGKRFKLVHVLFVSRGSVIKM